MALLNMGYSKDIVKGISWIGSLSFLTKAAGFLEVIILARILAPAQFGAYSIALIALGLLETITETGVNIVLIQEKNTEKYINSAWIVSIIRGIVISIVLIISAPFVSSFFHSSESLSLLYLVSVVPFLRGFINPAVVKFQKNLMFGKNFSYRVVILLFDTSLSILLTYILKNPIGIIIGLVGGVILELILSFLVVKPRPGFSFNRTYIGTIFHRGKWVTGSSIFDYLFNNIDNITVGRILGASSLGIYQMAYALSVMPLSEVGKVFVHVTVPVFVRISHDKNRLRSAFLKTIVSIFIISFPFVLILVLFPQIFVMVLGQKWTGVAPVLPILAAVGLVKALSISSSAVFISLKKQNYTTIVTFVSIIVLLATIVPFVMERGVVGAGISELISSLIAIPIILFFLVKLFFQIKKEAS